MSVFKELKRRNVFRVAAAYVIVGWLIMQAGEVMGPALHLPEWVNSLLAFFLILGFPMALFFAWAYELTPEGIKKEKDIDRSQSVTHVTGRKLDYLIITVLVVALGYFQFDKFVLDPSRDAELVQATTEVVTEQVATEPEISAASDNSIVVLPFVNMSSDPEQEYFSDGISEELLNLLAKIPELRVISRSSAFAFKGEKVNIPEVAKKLNVAHVLEGSVRKAGNQVRITAQLIDARADTHLWSETYDRTLDDIFAIQDEIAVAVVEQLKVTLLGDIPTVKEVNPEAYALYLQAMYLHAQGTAEALEQSNTMLKQVLDIAPNYARAWSGLYRNYGSQVRVNLLPRDEGDALRTEALNKALAIDPYLAEAHAWLGSRAMREDRDFAAAAKHLKYALSLDPTNVIALSEASWLVLNLGHMDEAIAIREYEVTLTPLDPISHSNLAYIYFEAEQPDKTIASIRTTLMLAPDSPNTHWILSMALLQKGENEAALKAIQQESWEDARLEGMALVYHALGQAAESDAALDELIEKYEKKSPFFIASVLAYRGEADRAFEWLDKAVEYKSIALNYLHFYPLFANIHEDPRWLPFLESNGMAPEQLAAFEFNVKLPD